MSTAEIVEFFGNAAVELDEKDEIYRSLVALAQERDASSTPADVVFLGLFPGIDRGLRRVRRKTAVELDELVSLFWLALTRLILTARLSRINRVAATLVRSTERDVWRGLRAERGEPLEALPASDSLPDPATWGVAAFGFPRGLGTRIEARLLRRDLARLVGPDADLLIATAVLGETHQSLARDAGVGRAECGRRQRAARARARSLLRLGDESVVHGILTRRLRAALCHEERNG